MKKGSAKAKAWGRKMKLLRNRAKPKSKRLTKLKVNNVVRRRRITRRPTRRRKAPKFNTTKAIVGGATYGALREKISQLISPMTQKIPGGVYADNLAMGIVSYFAIKKGQKLPMGKYVVEAGKAGLYAESVLAGVDLGQNLFSGAKATNPYFS